MHLSVVVLNVEVCQVAMNRDKFPEKVPFRATRMLVNAMNASKIEGIYRTTCNEVPDWCCVSLCDAELCRQVMNVLWANRGSVLAMLEAFVHDPLINWRLLKSPTKVCTTAC